VSMVKVEGQRLRRRCLGGYARADTRPSDSFLACADEVRCRINGREHATCAGGLSRSVLIGAEVRLELLACGWQSDEPWESGLSAMWSSTAGER